MRVSKSPADESNHISPSFRRSLAVVARCHLRVHHTPQQELIDGLEIMVAAEQVGWERFQDVDALNRYIAANRFEISKLILEAIERGSKEGPL